MKKLTFPILLSFCIWTAPSCAASDTAAASMQLLTDGNQRFAQGHLVHPDQSMERRVMLSQAQHPFAAILSCSDSRVPPELVFDSGLGDLFTIRVAGNVVDTAVLGSIEYGAKHLNVPMILVLGHTGCGAVKATVETHEPRTHIEALIKDIHPAVDRARRQTGDVYLNAVRENVYQSVNQLREAKPIMNLLCRENKLQVFGAVYHIDTGVVEFLPSR